MKKIYIVLSQTGTLFSRALRVYTKDPYNHASLSFDKNLHTMYSFGRKSRYNIFNSGFVLENFNNGLYRFFPNASCQVLEVSVTQAEYDSMLEAVELFYDNIDAYRYNILGIVGFMVGLRLGRKNHFFCSQFVSQILMETDMWDRIPEFTKPMDFRDLPNVRIIYEGNILEYIHADTFHGVAMS